MVKRSIPGHMAAAIVSAELGLFRAVNEAAPDDTLTGNDEDLDTLAGGEPVVLTSEPDYGPAMDRLCRSLGRKTSRYDGPTLRRLRAERGVGRPPRKKEPPTC